MNRKELIYKLNDIESTLNNVMLEESIISGTALGTWFRNHQKISNLFKLCFTTVSTAAGAKMDTLPKWAYWVSTGIKGALGIVGIKAWNRRSSYKDKYYTLKNTLTLDPSVLDIKNEAAKGSSAPADPKKEGLLEKIWNTFTSQLEKIRSAIAGGVKTITDTIGTVPFLVLGFGTALMAIMASVVVYYIQVGGNVSSSIKSAFEDAFSGIKTANGIEALVNLFLIPVKLCFNFVKQSPFAALLFGFGLCIAFTMIVASVAGWDVLFPPEDDNADKLPKLNKRNGSKKQTSGKIPDSSSQSDTKMKTNSK